MDVGGKGNLVWILLLIYSFAAEQNSPSSSLAAPYVRRPERQQALAEEQCSSAVCSGTNLCTSGASRLSPNNGFVFFPVSAKTSANVKDERGPAG